LTYLPKESEKLKNALDRNLESVKDEYDTLIKVNTIRGATLNS